MTAAPDEQLESQLRDLTTWPDPTPNLWRRALSATGAPERKDRSPLRRVLSYRPSLRLATAAAAVIIFIAVGVVMHDEAAQWASENIEWFPQHYYQPEFTGGAAGEILVAKTPDFRGYPNLSYGYQLPETLRNGPRGGSDVRLPIAADKTPYFVDADGDGGESTRLASTFTASGDSQPNAAERYVIRKATIELAAKDVKAAFLKASYLISEAKGEYVQDSGITGSGEKMQANLTLRVTAERLPEVLNELRQFGEVRSEKTTGEDVTTQVVDLEARLRNEQRVETELLQLLEKRDNAPLKEILELRRAIADVRQTIERLTAQRERLSRLVSLATVLVIIRPADAPPPKVLGLGTYFLDALGNAWHKGSMFLVNTFAGIVSVLIGGLIWWLLLIAVILTVRSYRTRRSQPT